MLATVLEVPEDDKSSGVKTLWTSKGAKMTESVKSINITYCGSWGYKSRAVSLAAELEKKVGVAPVLHQSYGGIFEVEVDGNLIFSKSKLGRFPEPGEVQHLIQPQSIK